MQPAIRHTLRSAAPARALALALCLLVLTACASLGVTEDYDPQIEDGLNEYHKNFVAFVTRMEQAAGTTAGSYEGEDARAFYSTSQGELANLVVRAEARNPQGQCFASSKVASGVTSALASATDYYDSNPGQSPPTQALGSFVKDSFDALSEGGSELAAGSCTVVVLKALKLNHEILRSIHERRRYLTPPASDIAEQLISGTVTMAIITEQSKQP